MDARKLKEKAAEAFAKGRFSKAAELYEQFCAADPKDVQARLRMGDAWARSGNRDKAIKAYQSAAERFARDGFLPRAIAASKLILELDPSHKGVQQMLADLYARRGTSASGARGEGGPTLSSFPASAANRRAPGGLAESARPTHRPDAIELSDDDETPLELETSASLPLTVQVTPDDGSASSEQEEAPGAVPTYELSLESDEAPMDLSDELPPELAVGLISGAPPAPTSAPPAPVPPAPTPAATVSTPVAPVPAPVVPSQATADEGVDIDIDVDAPGQGASPSAPPGLRPKRAQGPSEPAPSAPAIPPAASEVPPGITPIQRVAAAPPASPARFPGSFSRFDELDLDMAPPSADGAGITTEDEGSLLHAVDDAARSGMGEVEADGHEETVFSTEDMAETPSPDALPKIPLFSDLAPEAFIELFERCPLRRFPRYAVIVQQGTQGDSFFVICEGIVRVWREEESGERKDLAILQEGAFFGEMALLSDAPRSASVESVADETQLLEIPAQVLAELSRRYPSVAQALKKFCRQRMLSNLMSTSALFRPFNRDDRKQLIERFRARDVEKDYVVIREGDRTDGLYVLLSGEVEVKKGTQTLARLREGEVFGEMSLLQKTPATATVITTKRTSLLRLPREDFDALILSHPQILELVAELTEDRRRQMEAVLSGAAVVGEEGLLLV